ncbi:MAG: sigma-54-dependent Fis family transcriptional regulator [Gammaproteobacteria bacterium]|nr:sigma-54-dependent Fis family transcriptional regulator [Gammaproteobacteria bacterium]
MQRHILLVEDDRALREALSDSLQLAGFQCEAAADAKQAIVALQERSFSMVLSDINMPGMDGQELLGYIVKNAPGTPVVLMTAYGDVQGAVHAMRNGAVDYLLKPFSSKALLKLVERYALGAMSDDEAVAVDPASVELLKLAKRVALTDATVLITGESGTGKEVLARYIHQHSACSQGPFVAINCAAIPETMLEATLFGHEKGAFTGAVASKPGKFEQANGGTLLLDEISEMPVELQAKLLRVLQEREVERVGGSKVIKLDVRVLATSNRDLPQNIAQGRFREDLYYRLSVFPLAWLPLRERPLDIVPLAERLLAVHAAKQGRAGACFARSAQQALQQYGWPGNVRELDNVVQRALILQQGHCIEVQDLGLQGFVLSATSAQTAVAQQNETSVTAAASNDLEQDTRMHEFHLIAQALRQENGHREATAKRLGISSRTLRYKLAQMRDIGLLEQSA